MVLAPRCISCPVEESIGARAQGASVDALSAYLTLSSALSQLDLPALRLCCFSSPPFLSDFLRIRLNVVVRPSLGPTPPV